MRTSKPYQELQQKNKMQYDQSSSQSDIEDQQQYQQNMHQYSQSQESDLSSNQNQSPQPKKSKQQVQDNSSEQEDSLDERRLQPTMGVLKQQNSDEEDDSIDHIEQRIKKLERDLQDRLDKHKKKDIIKKQVKKPQQKTTQHPVGTIIPTKKQPPLPQNQPIPKKIQKQQKRQANQQVQEQELPQTRINFKPKQQQQSNQKDLKENAVINTRGQNKKEVKQNNPELSNKINSPKKKGKLTSISGNNVKSKKLVPDQFKKMQQTIEDLRWQNRKLKDQINASKKKKKPIQELVQLKQLSQHDTRKLQKELQLLKVLERLQNKLKNSIQKKLGKGSVANKMQTHAALLHKGLPSNIIN